MVLRRMASPALGFLSVVALGGCDLLGPTCATYAVHGIGVTVVDSVTRDPMITASDVMVVASDGAYADTVRGPLERYFGSAPLALERRGTYRVTVTAEGYRAWEKDGVRVAEGRCHVRSVTLEALMQPLDEV